MNVYGIVSSGNMDPGATLGGRYGHGTDHPAKFLSLFEVHTRTERGLRKEYTVVPSV